ncbi:hypothetical protein RUK45_003383 [Vibrio cholerae]|nr:hypothetical protein [Vibrio cholerae]
MYEVDIFEKTKEGMCSALSDAVSFTENFASIANAEYLITTNVAQKISELGPLRGPAQISTHVEMPTKDFASKCVPLMKQPIVKNFSDLHKKTVFRKPKNTERNGRIDIAVLKQGTLENTPICAIELKGFNPAKNLVIKDLNRNLEYFKLYCSTGKSQIEFTQFCAIYQFSKAILKSDIPKNIQAVTTKYQSYLSALSIPSDVEFDMKVFSASERLLNGDESDDEYDSISHELHHHVGVIIIFRWKSQP